MQPMGDSIGRKAKTDIRIYTQNINGIKTDDMSNDLHNKIQVMTDRQVDIFGWSETNLEWQDYTTHKTTQTIAKKHLPGGHWNPTTSTIPTETQYKPGGNVIGSNYSINSRTTVKGKDDYGRWTGMKIRGKSKPISIIQLYTPCKNKTGLNTTYQQQYE